MSIRVDETKPDIEATEPAIPTTCSPEDLPDEELLYDLADLFKVFSDTTRIKILYALMGRELLRGRHRRSDRNLAVRGVAPAAHTQAVAPG